MALWNSIIIMSYRLYTPEDDKVTISFWVIAGGLVAAAALKSMIPICLRSPPGSSRDLHQANAPNRDALTCPGGYHVTTKCLAAPRRREAQTPADAASQTREGLARSSKST